MDTFTCPTHNIEIEKKVGAECLACVADMLLPVPTSTMGRVLEMQRWFGVVTVTFSRIHTRLEELIGRAVWTHEFAQPELLYAEVCKGDTITMDEIIGKFPADKSVIILDTD